MKAAVRSEKCEVWSVKCEVRFFSDFGCLQTPKLGKCNEAVHVYILRQCCVRIVHLPAAIVWIMHVIKSIRREQDHIQQACNVAIIYSVLREQVSTNIMHVHDTTLQLRRLATHRCDVLVCGSVGTCDAVVRVG